MQRKSFHGMNCSVARSLDEVGEWWSLLIVRECLQGTRRFDEFQEKLGIARNILTARLERLIKAGVIKRYPCEERANTDGYRLTEKGEQLYPVIVALTQWGDRWLAPDGKPPITLVDDVHGRPIERISVRNAEGRLLSYRDVRMEPGPGATARTREAVTRRNTRVLSRKDA
jgi:DNA-binding HxlR family transcriptional regulator